MVYDSRIEFPAGSTVVTLDSVISSGIFRVSFDILVEDTETSPADNTKDSLIYLLPSSASLPPSSANSLTTININRRESVGATTRLVKLEYRDNVGFNDLPQVYLARRVTPIRMALVCNLTSKKVDIYVNDILWVSQEDFANGSAANCDRIVLFGQASAPTTYIENLTVEENWTLPTESVLIDHTFVGESGEVEALTLDSDVRNLHAQPWKIPDDTTTYGAFTSGANGLQPDASNVCAAIVRARPEGILEMEFQTSVAGVIYAGMQFRHWALASNGSAGLLRMQGGAANNIILYLPDSGSTPQAQQTTALTPDANSTYTLKVEMRGRFISGSYKKAAMDAGSYTALWTHQVTSSATGGRGMLAEEEFGPYISTDIGATDNYIRRIRFTGRIPTDEKTVTVGGMTFVLGYGALREFYHSATDEPTSNLLLSRGIQCGHRSRADTGNYHCVQDTIYEATNVSAYRQRAENLTEYERQGYADLYWTFLRRGPWVADRIQVWGTTENMAPDHDLRGDFWNGSNYRVCGPSGASSALNDAPFHDWRTDVAANTLPQGFQKITTFAGDNIRMTAVARNNLNLTGSVHYLANKNIGDGSPISLAFTRNGANIVDDTTYEWGRAYLIESASALSGATLTGFRDDVASPATLAVSTGTLDTAVAGDIDADGFNERHGWYELACSGGAASWSVPGTRYMPAFRLSGATGSTYTVTIDGSAAVENVDYTLDVVDTNVVVLQLLSVTTDVDVALSTDASSSGNRGAGSNKRRKERKYVLEMDDKMYQVSSLEQARAILQSRQPVQKKNKTLKLPNLTIELGEVSRVKVKNVPLVKALTMNVPLDWIEDAIQRIEDDEEEALLLLLH
jgi:hypothetical protein